MSPVETQPDFGLYRPVLLEERPRIAAVARTAQLAVRGYLAAANIDATITRRSDFGVTFMSRQALATHLEDNQAPFDLSQFVENVNTAVRPAEVAPLYLSVVGALVTYSNRKDVWLRLDHTSEEGKALKQQRAGLRTVFDEMGFCPRLQQVGHITLITARGSREPHRIYAHQRQIKAMTAEIAAKAGLTTVGLDRLVIGSDYRKPLPGTEPPDLQ